MRRGRRCWALACAWLPAVACEPQVTSVGAWAPVVESGQYLEAERGELSVGFSIAADPAASGGQFISPPLGLRSDGEPGLERARYTLNVPVAGDYVIWGRIYSPNATNNRFWFQVDEGTWYLWRMSTGETWFWDDLHDDTSYHEPLRFPLAAGKHELVVANAIEGALLDRFYFTSEADEPPGNDTPCRPPHSIEIAGECQPSCGSLDGTKCGAAACQGRELLEAYDCTICCHVP